MQIAEDNAMAALYLFDRVFGSGITGHVYDLDSEEPIVATIKVLEVDLDDGYILEPKTSDSLYGRFFRMLNEGTYTVVVSKEGYDPDTIQDVVVSSDTLTYLFFELDAINPYVDESQIENFGVQLLPNPTNGISHFTFNISQYQHMTLKIYDLHGREVATVVDERMPAGEHTVRFDARSLPVGIYFCRVRIGEKVETIKMIIL
jgi:hypothetical protein